MASASIQLTPVHGVGPKHNRRTGNAKKLILAATVTLLLSSVSAIAAYDWNLSAHVVAVEATYIPDHVTFQIDGPAGTSCPAGSWLVWPGQGTDAVSKQANVQAVYSLLLAAKLSYDTIDLFGNNGNVQGFCAAATFIHLH